MVASSVTKAKLKLEQDKIIKLQGFYSSNFRSKSQFEEGDTQNYLLSIMQRYF